MFETLSFLPDPIPENDDHYKSFSDVYGQTTSEQHRPSLTRKPRQKIGFTPSQQHVRNVGTLIQCEECDKWRLMFCSHKLSRQEIVTHLDDVSDLNFPGRLKTVCVKDHACIGPIEKLYYSCGFEPICYYCATTVNFLMCAEWRERKEGQKPIKRPKTKD